MNDPVFLEFDGTPVPGRVPVKYSVMTPHVSALTVQAVQHAYADFCTTKRLSLAQTHAVDLSLPNGARARIISRFDIDSVFVWEDAGDDEKLPHGLLVIVPWHPPFIFRKDREEGWVIAGDHIPQAVQPIYAYNGSENVEGAAFYITPFVRNQWLLWDHIGREAYDNGEAPVPAPVNLRLGGAPDNFGSATHDAFDNAIKAEAEDLYSMEDSPAILFDESDLLNELPTDTDTVATRIAMNSYRRAALSDYVYKYRFCSEEVRRSSEESYNQVHRYVTDVTAAESLNNVDIDQNSTFIGPTDRNGVLEDVDIAQTGAYTATHGATGLVAIRYWYTLFDFRTLYSRGTVGVRWGVRDNETTIPETLKVRRQDGYTHVLEESAVDETVTENVLLLGDTEGLSGVIVKTRYSYPTSRYWRAGTRSVDFDPTDVYGTSFPLNYYAQTQKVKDRRNAEVLMTPESHVDVELGWTTIRLFDTAGSGALSGSYYAINTTGQNNIDPDFANEATSTPYHPGESYSSPSDGTIPRTDYINLRWYSASQSGKMAAEILSKKARYTGTSSLVERDEACVNTVEYTYTSRTIIDYDHRSRFYAAIRVEVDCRGMARDDSTGPRGFLTTHEGPTYTVRIHFESKWKDKDLVEVLLVEETGEHPGFEFATISHENPFLWPFDGALAYPTYVQLPPALALPSDGMDQLITLVRHQGVNTNFCAEYYQPAAGDFESERGIEYSYLNRKTGIITPHDRYCAGMLYCRTFKLSDMPGALWLIKATKCDATENNALLTEPYFYMPALGSALQEVRHIELRDGAVHTWTDEIPQEGDTARPTSLTSRDDVKLYKV